MSDGLFANVISLIGMLVVPWIIWITASIFNQRQELALVRQILDNLVKKS